MAACARSTARGLGTDLSSLTKGHWIDTSDLRVPRPTKTCHACAQFKPLQSLCSSVPTSSQSPMWGQLFRQQTLQQTLRTAGSKGKQRLCMRNASGKQDNTQTVEAPKNEAGGSGGDGGLNEEGVGGILAKEQEVGGPLSKIMWGFYAAYVAYMLFLPSGPGLAPGDPLWAMKWPAWKEVFDLSFNFQLFLTGLNAAGIHVVEAPHLHPVNEGLFNFVIIWSLMFAPLMIGDKRKVSLKTKELLWLGTLFLTNVFAIPYIALRSGRPVSSRLEGVEKDSLTSTFAKQILQNRQIIGVSGLSIGFFMVYWFFFGRSEFGGVAERVQYFRELLTYDRVMFAFVWDVILYSVFQAWLVLDAPQPKGKEGLAKLGAIPFVGLGLYLILQPRETDLEV